MQSPFKQIFVQLQNGIMVPINELPKEQYEYFLELTDNVRQAYTAIKFMEEGKDKVQNEWVKEHGQQTQ